MAQNKPTDGQGMVVDLAPTVRVVEAKLTADIDSLKAVFVGYGDIVSIFPSAEARSLASLSSRWC